MSRDYSNLPNAELEIIIKDGLRSEFWKWFTATYDEGQKLILDSMVSLNLTSWDDLVKIVKLQSSYKSREEIFNYPLTTLKVIEIETKQKSD